MPSYAVTGASRGLGLELVRQLSDGNENTVFAIVRSPSTAENLKKLCGSRDNLHIVQADLDDAKSWKIAAQEVASKTGGDLDVFINNAANTSTARDMMKFGLDEFPSEEQLTEALQSQFHSNTIGAIYATNAFIPLIKEGNLKKVVNISSGMADLDFVLRSGGYQGVHYSLAKAALNMANVKYANEYRDAGIAFLALSPGFVNTIAMTPTPEEMQFIQRMFEGFRTAEPDWNGKPLLPEESVRMCLDVIDKFTVKDTGAFWSHHGNNTKWL